MRLVYDVRAVCGDTCRLTHCDYPPILRIATSLPGREGELEVLCLGLVGANRDVGGLRPELLVPGRDLVSPRVETRDRELPVRARHRIEGMGKDAEIGFHPGVDVALDAEDCLRLVELRGRFLAGGRKRLVE